MKKSLKAMLENSPSILSDAQKQAIEDKLKDMEMPGDRKSSWGTVGGEAVLGSST
jgi:hypothetical protein